MANLTDRAANRGQLLIIAAVGLAILLVVMALALNTAVFGGVHVAGTDASLHEERAALEYQDAIERGVGGIFPSLRSTGDYDELEAVLDQEVANVSGPVDRQFTNDGVATSTSAEPLFETSVAHNDSTREFTNKTGDSDWALAENVSNVTSYEMEIFEDNLAQVNECATEDACFTLEVNGDWQMSVNSTSNNIFIIVNGNPECSTSNESIQIDLVEGTGDGDCEFPAFTEEPYSQYTIEYTNADNSSGTYNLTVDGELDDEDFYDAGSGASPRLAAELVGADVTIEYRSATLHYTNEVRVWRGDEDE